MADFPSSFDKDDLLKCARGELFGPGNAQLPEPPMLMMDRITDCSEDRGEHAPQCDGELEGGQIEPPGREQRNADREDRAPRRSHRSAAR